MTEGRRVPAGALALMLVATPAARAYQSPLDTHSVREAYFLGNRKDERAAKFLAQYVKQLPLPKKGPHVAEIELLTPYAQAVLRAYKTPGGYSAQDAERDYAAHPDLIRVRVRILLTPTYTDVITRGKEGPRQRPPDFWQDFKIQFMQGRIIAPKKVSGTPIYTPGVSLQGAEVWLEFDALQIGSEPTRLRVLTPDGQTVEAEFDLKDLR